jgi:hypothetical protein
VTKPITNIPTTATGRTTENDRRCPPELVANPGTAPDGGRAVVWFVALICSEASRTTIAISPSVHDLRSGLGAERREVAAVVDDHDRVPVGGDFMPSRLP